MRPFFSFSPVGVVGVVAALGLAGCGYYSFTGASIPSHLDTIAIPLVENTSASPLTGLDDQMTQLLQQRFVGQTRLSLATNEEEADVVLNVQIRNYVNQPTSVGGDERAEQNRVSITVDVRYFDRVEEEEVLARTFTGSAEYDPLDGGLQGEIDAAFAALEDIADDVFTAATSNW